MKEIVIRTLADIRCSGCLGQDNAVLETGAQGLEPAQRRIALGFPQRGEAARWGMEACGGRNRPMGQ